MTPEEFKAALAAQNINLSDDQLAQFATYYQRLVAVNEHVNLTRITEEGEVYLKHFYDSILGAVAYPALQTEALTLLDVGAGAGFPSLPLKIINPALEVTIVDSLNKRINFLSDLVDELGLTKVHLVHARAEEFSQKKSPNRESFDVVSARAVARLSVLSELCLPAAKVGGTFLAYKAAAAEDELKDAKRAITTLGGEVKEDVTLTLPTKPEAEERHLIVIEKVKQTPAKYPRRPGLPSKKPL